MPLLQAGNVKLYYEQQGTGRDLWLVSGYGTNRFSWKGLLPYLTDFRVTFVENRGSGESDAPPAPYTMSQLAEDIAHAMEALHMENAIFLGQSMGGSIVQELAIAHPHKVSSAILCSTTACFSPIFKTHIQSIRALMDAGVDTDLIVPLGAPWIFSNSFLSNRKNIERILQERRKNPYPQSSEGHRGQMEALLSFDARDRLGQIRCPVQIISGEEDLYTPVSDAKELHRGIKESSLSLIPKMGHAVLLEAPQLVLDRLKL